METPESICAFWFDPEASIEQREHLWWSKDEAVDVTMRRRFEGCVHQAGEHALDGWSTTPQGRLALILLTDQFPRNIYRDTPMAFAFDPLACAWCKEGLEQGMDRLLPPIKRVFFYLPLEHSEALPDQLRSLVLFEQLLSECDVQQRTEFQSYLDFARRHCEIIHRFGRFPHRNKILGRASTSEELHFLQQKESSF